MKKPTFTINDTNDKSSLNHFVDWEKTETSLKLTPPKKRLTLNKDEITFYSNLDHQDQSNWWVPLHGAEREFVYDEGRDAAYEWMKLLAKERQSKKIHWFRAYSLKHDVEHWKVGNPNRRYVSKDMAISAALLVGLPITINTRFKFNHEIGLYMTERQYEKFREQHNVKA